jgi:hypothetical protein
MYIKYTCEKVFIYGDKTRSLSKAVVAIKTRERRRGRGREREKLREIALSSLSGAYKYESELEE